MIINLLITQLFILGELNGSKNRCWIKHFHIYNLFFPINQPNPYSRVYIIAILCNGMGEMIMTESDQTCWDYNTMEPGPEFLARPRCSTNWGCWRHRWYSNPSDHHIPLPLNDINPQRSPRALNFPWQEFKLTCQFQGFMAILAPSVL